MPLNKNSSDDDDSKFVAIFLHISWHNYSVLKILTPRTDGRPTESQKYRLWGGVVNDPLGLQSLHNSAAYY